MNRSANAFLYQSSCWQNRFRCCLAACVVVSAVHAAEVDLTPVPGGGRILHRGDRGRAAGVAEYRGLAIPLCPSSGFLRLHRRTDALRAGHVFRRCRRPGRSAIRFANQCLHDLSAPHPHLARRQRPVCQRLLRTPGRAVQQAPERQLGLPHHLWHHGWGASSGADASPSRTRPSRIRISNWRSRVPGRRATPARPRTMSTRPRSRAR